MLMLQASQTSQMSAGVIFLQVFMWVAVLLTFILLIPGVWIVFKTRNTVSISKWMYVIYPICSLTWIVYAILLVFESIPIYEIIGIAIAEFISGAMSLYILVIKLKNLSEAKKQHMSESEWYKAYLKQRKEKEQLKALGIHSDLDLKNSQEHQNHLSKILDDLFTGQPNIVDDRITSSKQYRKSVNKTITTPAKRLEHFKNVATNAEIANVISLIYLDMYQGKKN